MRWVLAAMFLAPLDEGWGDEPPIVDGYRRVSESALVQDQGLDGARVYLDGKFGGATRERLLLQASRVGLVSIGRDFDPSQFAAYGRDTNIRVFGTVVRGDLGVTLHVEHVERLPDDRQRYAQARNRLMPGDAAGLYALGERLRVRAARYKSSELEAWSKDSFRAAIEVEGRAWKRDAGRLYALAERALELVGDRPLSERLAEAGLAAERKALPADDPDARFRLAAAWERRLPGRAEAQALKREGLDLEARRLPRGDPSSRYRLAQRYLLLVQDHARAEELNREGLALEEAALSPRDYQARYRLAERVSELVGDQRWARTLVAEAAADERQQLAGRPPSAYFHLAERYARDLDDPATRNALMREGLAVQQRRLDPKDLNGHLDLALAYLAALEDRQACTQWLRYCLTLVPDEPRVREKLAALGLVEVNGEWHERSAVESDPQLAWQARLEEAVAAGRILEGMTPAQVRRAWGNPQSHDAAYTHDGRTVIWTYPGARPTRVAFRHGRVVAWSR